MNAKMSDFKSLFLKFVIILAYGQLNCMSLIQCVHQAGRFPALPALEKLAKLDDLKPYNKNGYHHFTFYDKLILLQNKDSNVIRQITCRKETLIFVNTEILTAL